MDDAVFDELMGQTFDQPAAEDPQAPTGAAQDAEAAGWVTEDLPETDASTEESASVPDAEPEAQSQEPAAQLPSPQQFWELDANPYKQQAIQAQQQAAAAQKFMEEMRVKQAMVEMDRQLQQRIEALPDMEPEQLTKEVQRLIAERDAIKEMFAQAQVAEHQQHAEQIAKVQVVQILAERHGLTETEVETIRQMNDPYQMEKFAQSAQQTRQVAMSEVERLRQQLAQYQLAQQAQARRGVDRVGTNAPTARATTTPSPKTFDEFWASFVNEG